MLKQFSNSHIMRIKEPDYECRFFRKTFTDSSRETIGNSAEICSGINSEISPTYPEIRLVISSGMFRRIIVEITPENPTENLNVDTSSNFHWHHFKIFQDFVK